MKIKIKDYQKESFPDLIDIMAEKYREGTCSATFLHGISKHFSLDISSTPVTFLRAVTSV
jgi:hypothetical protein